MAIDMRTDVEPGEGEDEQAQRSGQREFRTRPVELRRHRLEQHSTDVVASAHGGELGDECAAYEPVAIKDARSRRDWLIRVACTVRH